MATTYKNAQAAGGGTFGTWASLYQCPSATQAILSTISVCNTTGAAITYGIAIKSSVATPGASECIVYNSSVAAYDTVFITVGVVLEASEYLLISSSSASVGFAAFVSEIS